MEYSAGRCDTSIKHVSHSPSPLSAGPFLLSLPLARHCKASLTYGVNTNILKAITDSSPLFLTPAIPPLSPRPLFSSPRPSLPHPFIRFPHEARVTALPHLQHDYEKNIYNSRISITENSIQSIVVKIKVVVVVEAIEAGVLQLAGLINASFY